MDFFEEMKRITDLYAAGVRAGAGLPPLKAAAEPSQEAKLVESGEGAQPNASAPAAAPIQELDWPAREALRQSAHLQPPAAAPKPVPQIWTHIGHIVYKCGKSFCSCETKEAAWFIADQLNAFDANLVERNRFHSLYLLALRGEEDEKE